MGFASFWALVVENKNTLILVAQLAVLAGLVVLGLRLAWRYAKSDQTLLAVAGQYYRPVSEPPQVHLDLDGFITSIDIRHEFLITQNLQLRSRLSQSLGDNPSSPDNSEIEAQINLNDLVLQRLSDDRADIHIFHQLTLLRLGAVQRDLATLHACNVLRDHLMLARLGEAVNAGDLGESLTVISGLYDSLDQTAPPHEEAALCSAMGNIVGEEAGETIKARFFARAVELMPLEPQYLGQSLVHACIVRDVDLADRLSAAWVLLAHALLAKTGAAPANPLYPLAKIYIETNRPEYTEPVYRRLLHIHEQVLGAQHPSVATGYGTLAHILDNAARFEEAEVLYRRELDIDLASLDENSVGLGYDFSNLAFNLTRQNRFEEAEPLFRKALDISLEVFGDAASETAESFGNLGGCLLRLGNYSEAEVHVRKMLAIHERDLGVHHHRTAAGYSMLASILDHLGRLAEAEPLHHNALELKRAEFGEDHPETVLAHGCLALNLTRQERHGEAEMYFRSGLEAHIRMFGEEDISVATAYRNLAGTLDAQGKFIDAEPLYRRAMEVEDRVLGDNDPGRASGFNDLAINLDEQQRYDEAEPLYRMALDIRFESFGDEHADTAISYRNLSSNLFAQGRENDARPMMEKAVMIARRVLGDEHPETQNYMQILAMHYSA